MLRKVYTKHKGERKQKPGEYLDDTHIQHWRRGHVAIFYKGEEGAGLTKGATRAKGIIRSNQRRGGKMEREYRSKRGKERERDRSIDQEKRVNETGKKKRINERGDVDDGNEKCRYGARPVPR